MSYSPKGGAVNGAVIGSPQNALYQPQGGGYQGQMQPISGNAGGQNAMMRPQYGSQAPEQNAEKDEQRQMELLQGLYKEEFETGKTDLDFDGWFGSLGGG